MLLISIGIVYGIGLGLTLVGGLLYVIILGGLHTAFPLWKFLLGIVFWPATWGFTFYKLYKSET